MQDLGDDLGAAAGRIVRVRNSIPIRRGAASDDRTALAGTVVSVVGGIAVAVGTGGRGVAAIGAGATGDVGIDAGFDRLFPADAEITALRTALGDDRFDLEMWRYLVVEALWERDRAYFGDTPPPVEIDGTLSSLSGPTIGEAACFAADPRAVDQWYSWLGDLPDDLRRAIDAIADTVNSRVAEESRLRIGD